METKIYLKYDYHNWNVELANPALFMVIEQQIQASYKIQYAKELT